MLRARGYSGVGVRHGTRLSGRMLRQSGMSQSEWSFVALDTMVAVLKASLQVNLATFGDLVLRQRGGAPYRGPSQRSRRGPFASSAKSELEAAEARSSWTPRRWTCSSAKCGTLTI